jgi:hypothetical protein
MKRLFMIAAVLICSVSVAEAQSFKDLLKQAATKAATEAATQAITKATTSTTSTTTNTETTTSNTTVSALGNLATSLLGSVLGTQVSEESIVGTWTYSKPAVQFTTEDLLRQAGGAAAASMVEDKLAEGLTKIGLNAGAMSYTFNEDKSFVITIGKRTIKGTYELDPTTKEITFHFGQGKLGDLVKHTMTLTKTGSNIDLVGNADKLLKLVQNTISSSKNTTLSTIGKLAEGYDGMMIGFSFTK